MHSLRELVTPELTALTSAISNLTKIPVAINPGKTWAEVKLAAESALNSHRRFEADQIAADRGRITELTREITSLEVASIDLYKDGAVPVIKTVDASTVNTGPVEVANHLHKQAQSAKGVLAAISGMRTEALFGLSAGFFLVLVGAIGVMQPLITKAMGDNGDPSTLGAVVWAVIVASAVALTIGAVNVTFFRQVTNRLAPWKAVLVGLAIFFLTGRYVASAMNADFLLMQDLPSQVQTAIRIMEAIGIAIALVCVELGAGRCFAFFWLRFQQTRTNPPRLEQLLREIAEWSRLRAAEDGRARNAAQPIQISDLYKQAAGVVSEAIDSGLMPHRDILRRHNLAIEQPWAGSALEHVDIDWLQAQILACELARDELLRLAGMEPTSPAMVTPAPHPSPLPTATAPKP